VDFLLHQFAGAVKKTAVKNQEYKIFPADFARRDPP